MAVPRYEMSFGLLNNANEGNIFLPRTQISYPKAVMNMFYVLYKHQ